MSCRVLQARFSREEPDECSESADEQVTTNADHPIGYSSVREGIGTLVVAGQSCHTLSDQEAIRSYSSDHDVDGCPSELADVTSSSSNDPCKIT